MESKSIRNLPVAVKSKEENYRLGNEHYNCARYRKALPYFESAAAQEYPAAYLRLEWLYREDGRIGKIDLVKSELFSQKAASCFAWFKKQAKTGEADAQRNLGYCYEKGIGVEQNFRLAARYYQLAAEQGYAPAQNHLGCLYHSGMGVEQNFEQSIRYFELAADQNYAMAQTNLGICYQQGSGVKRDFEKAVHYYQRAALQKDVNALNNLGFCYDSGQGVSQDTFEAKLYYRLAGESKRGSTLACNNLAFFYQNRFKPIEFEYMVFAGDIFRFLSYGIKKIAAGGDVAAQSNLEVYYNHRLRKKAPYLAYKWLIKSAEQGNAQGQNGLGDCFKHGIHYKRNIKKAAYYYQLSAEQGNGDGQSNLGLCYKNGEGVEKDIAKALHYFRLSAEQNNAKGQNNLGNCYKNGEGVEQDIKKALHYYWLAFEQGYKEARNNLGNCYKNGEGVERDIEKALFHYRIAAKLGCASAQTNLGECYEQGEGVEKNIEQAMFYYELAADTGDALAQYRVGKYYYELRKRSIFGFNEELTKSLYYYRLSAERGNVDAQYAMAEHYYSIRESRHFSQENYLNAVCYYQLAAAQGHAQAQYGLGICYQNGYGVGEDFWKAVHYYRLAARQGNAEAKNTLVNLSQNSKRVQKKSPRVDYSVFFSEQDEDFRVCRTLRMDSGKAANVSEYNKYGVRIVRCLSEKEVILGLKGGGIEVWDISGSKRTYTLIGGVNFKSILDILVWRDRCFVAKVSGRELDVFSLTDYQFLGTFGRHGGDITCLAVLPNEWLITGSSDRTLKVWDVDSERCLATIDTQDGVNCVAVLRDGCVVSGLNNGTLKVWDVTNGRCLQTLSRPGHSAPVRCVAVFSSGRIISGSANQLKFWDVADDRCQLTLNGHADSVGSVAVWNNGYVAISSNNTLLKLHSGEKTLAGHNCRVSCVARLPNGWIVSGDDDGFVKVWKNHLPTLEKMFVVYLVFLQGNHQPTAVPYGMDIDCINHIFNFLLQPIGKSSRDICDRAKQASDRIYRDQTAKQSYRLMRHGFFYQPDYQSKKPLLFSLKEKLQLLVSQLPVPQRANSVESVFLEGNEMIIYFNSIASAHAFKWFYGFGWPFDKDDCLENLYRRNKFDLSLSKADTKITFRNTRRIEFFIEQVCKLPANELYKECPNFKPYEGEPERCVMM